MSETADAGTERKNTTQYVGASGKFVKGNPGKPKGAVTRKTVERRELFQMLERGDDELRPRFERVKSLLLSDDEMVRLQTERWIASYDWGLPKATLTVEGAINIAALLLSAHARINGGNGNGGHP